MSSEVLCVSGAQAEANPFGAPGALDVTVFSAMGRVLTPYAEYTREHSHELPPHLADQAELDTLVAVNRYQQQRAQVMAHADAFIPGREYGERLMAHYIASGDDTGGIPRVGVDGLPVGKDEMDREAMLAELYHDVLSPRETMAQPAPVSRAQREALRHAVAWRAQFAWEEGEVTELMLLCQVFDFNVDFLPPVPPGEQASLEEIILVARGGYPPAAAATAPVQVVEVDVLPFVETKPTQPRPAREKHAHSLWDILARLT